MTRFCSNWFFKLEWKGFSDPSDIPQVREEPVMPLQQPLFRRAHRKEVFVIPDPLESFLIFAYLFCLMGKGLCNDPSQNCEARERPL